MMTLITIAFCISAFMTMLKIRRFVTSNPGQAMKIGAGLARFFTRL